MTPPLAPYCEYGEGKRLLFAFHGYGMNGNQFRIMSDSLLPHYKIFAFHLPYHREGPPSDDDWMEHVVRQVRSILDRNSSPYLSLVGYSIGAKVVLALSLRFVGRVKSIYLFAPYGLERHWFVDFFSNGVGHLFFKMLLGTRFPEKLMDVALRLGMLDAAHHEVISNELNTRKKRHGLYMSLNMVAQISIDLRRLTQQVNEYSVDVVVGYGRNDLLFPYRLRNRKLLSTIRHVEVFEVDEGHGLVTPKLDHVLSRVISRKYTE